MNTGMFSGLGPAVVSLALLASAFLYGCESKPPAPVAPPSTPQGPAKPMSASEEQKVKQQVEQEAKDGKGE